MVFTGGIGENDADTRARACGGLGNLGIHLDDARNLSGEQSERAISTPDSAVQLLVIPTNEELEIAQQAVEAIGLTGIGPASVAFLCAAVAFTANAFIALVACNDATLGIDYLLKKWGVQP